MSFASRIRFFASVSVLLAVCLACGWGTEEGERSLTGECPAGEVCSSATPAGLTFIGHALFDDTTNNRLGPILAGGSFDLGLQATDGAAVPPFSFQIEDTDVLSGVRGEGVFGPTDGEGRPLLSVDGHVTLVGVAEGSTMVRVIDSRTGELFDRIELEVYRIEDIVIRNANDPDREHLLAGCDEMLGVRLIARNGAEEIRAFDQNITMRADGVVNDEPTMWDCFVYSVPEGRAEVIVEVETAGQTFTRNLQVRTLEDAGLTECPPLPRD